MTEGSRGWTSALPTAVVLKAATLGPLGHWTRSPGTVGSLAGLLFFAAVFTWLPVLAQAAWLVVTVPLAIAFCGEAEIRMGRKDAGIMVLDEAVAIPVCFLGLDVLVQGRNGWAVALAGLLLFRLFDILKPMGIRRLQSLPGGYGVVVDDVAAALATCAVLHLATRVFPTAFAA